MSSRLWVAILVGLPLAVIFTFLAWYTSVHSYGQLKPLTVGDATVYVTVAETESARERGLSGRSQLAPEEGMLFIFPSEGMYRFWMKEMKFSIDILWLSEDGTIVHIAPSVSPETYPETFVSELPARYVLELPEGYSEAHDISVGDKVSL